MADITLSEAKFAIENALISLLGLGAAKFIDAINAAPDKARLSAAVLSIISALESGHAESAKSLASQWMRMRNRI